MLTRTVFLTAWLLLAACRPTFESPGPTSMPTAAALTGSVDIKMPLDGSVIYSEVLFLAGSIMGVPDNKFVLKLIGPDNQILMSTTVQTEGSAWQVELLHGYNGAPIEVNIAVLPADPTSEGEYDIAMIALAGLEYRPQGAWINLRTPTDGSTVGGDSIMASGTASGLYTDELLLELRAQDDTVIDYQSITVDHHYRLDDFPWTADLRPQGYTGPAVLRAYGNGLDGEKQVLASASIQIGIEAG